jgi:hypothetical protein
LAIAADWYIDMVNDDKAQPVSEGKGTSKGTGNLKGIGKVNDKGKARKGEYVDAEDPEPSECSSAWVREGEGENENDVCAARMFARRVERLHEEATLERNDLDMLKLVVEFVGRFVELMWKKGSRRCLDARHS